MCGSCQYSNCISQQNNNDSKLNHSDQNDPNKKDLSAAVIKYGCQVYCDFKLPPSKLAYRKKYGLQNAI